MAGFWGWRPSALRTVMVHSKTEQTFKGALVDQRRDGFVLRATRMAQLDQNKMINWVPLDGDVVIPMENIDFWQEGLDIELLDISGIVKG